MPTTLRASSTIFLLVQAVVQGLVVQTRHPVLLSGRRVGRLGLEKQIQCAFAVAVATWNRIVRVCSRSIFFLRLVLVCRLDGVEELFFLSHWYPREQFCRLAQK